MKTVAVTHLAAVTGITGIAQTIIAARAAVAMSIIAFVIAGPRIPRIRTLHVTALHVTWAVMSRSHSHRAITRRGTPAMALLPALAHLWRRTHAGSLASLAHLSGRRRSPALPLSRALHAAAVMVAHLLRRWTPASSLPGPLLTTLTVPHLLRGALLVVTHLPRWAGRMIVAHLVSALLVFVPSVMVALALSGPLPLTLPVIAVISLIAAGALTVAPAVMISLAAVGSTALAATRIGQRLQAEGGKRDRQRQAQCFLFHRLPFRTLYPGYFPPPTPFKTRFSINENLCLTKEKPRRERSGEFPKLNS